MDPGEQVIQPGKRGYTPGSEERPAKLQRVEQDADSSLKQSSNPPIADASKLPIEATVVEENQKGRLSTSQGSVEHEVTGQEEEKVQPKLSKNQLKKQRRLEAWEAGRDERKAIRKEKIQAKKERKREAVRADPSLKLAQQSRRDVKSSKVPITVIFDCDFEDLMFDNELKSLGLQITRCYSDNKKAPFQMHLAVSSFGGKMKERFDGILAKQYLGWKGFQFLSEDFVQVAEKSKEWMKGDKGGILGGALSTEGRPEDDDNEEGEIVYLSSESDTVLERLKPNSTYIIGGLVDKNRHKGICHRRAKSKSIKTAKLPIGEFLQMKSRQVLVTNHVLEIMLKWVEYGDWGRAFMEVLPERKGAVLRSKSEEAEAAENAEGLPSEMDNETNDVLEQDDKGNGADEAGAVQTDPIS